MTTDDHCCDCGTALPDPDRRYLINGGALCDDCYIGRVSEAEAHAADDLHCGPPR